MFAEASTRLAVRALQCAVPLALCLAVTGCSFFKQFGKDRDKDRAADAGAPPPRFPTAGGNSGGAGSYASTAAVSTPNNQGAVLAGRVIDNYSRPPANTSIRWVNLDDKNPTENDISVTPEGYFTIQGLKPNSHYKLIARGKQGERLVAGVSYTTAPNIRVLIQVKEEFNSSSTPAVPGAPGAAPPGSANQGAKANLPGWPGGAGQGNEPALPVAINVLDNARSIPGRTPAQDWTPTPDAQKSSTWLPTLEIPKAKPSLAPLQIPAANSATTNVPGFSPAVADALARALVPSCVRAGNHVINFALNDVNSGQAWELKHRKGKLVLVDFWGTHCGPCLQAMPHIIQLQSKYGSQGLEVVGIACETGGTPEEQRQRVWNACKRAGVNYRQLLSTGMDCPVRKEFRIQYLPTLFLLDEQGFIVWQNDLNQSPADQRSLLERHIKHRLTPNAF